MTVPFVNSLRTPDDVIVLGNDSDPLHLRVQLADLWDAVQVQAPATLSLREVKQEVVKAVYADARPDDFNAKLHGFEILDESVSLAACGVRDGSTVLLSRRGRHPVR